MTADQGRSLTTTLVVHAIIAALLLMLSLSSKNPPYEEGLAGGGGGGSFVEFGTIDFADADVVPETQEEQITTETAEETETTPEEIITTETEETVAINSPKENPKDKPAEKPTETPKKKDTEVKPIPKTEPELPKVNQGALFKKKGDRPGGTGNGGNGGGGTGTGQGSGDGSGIGPGSGSGTGGGSGSGNGPGVGTGFDLTGRNWRKKPSLEDNSQETGKVVIEIVVDKNGNVTSANGPARGSTTQSPSLYQKAKQAALQAKFSPSAEGVEEQRGTITFDFRVR
jgi:TonB family protein